ncbi:ABC transporter ATP-binding protein [Variovorax ginsengisoli]|uniref:Spermidine/putrescine import ATP-binding protein PotA n=1 Tax=Variovorax ginsengisoli TaxID=363844 RepID=A0ABT9SA79_9BURK|nr:ABC transporter ATP-binding protein [Variovorax ginsengisoli]MDP9901266.1 putative spermidine/putrescine transport system ATP-binding protein [Variovorax ginsengisoli]
MPSSNLTISGLCKRYGDVTALAPTDLEVANGEFLTLLGPSGSGKTTLLSLIAGLSQPDGGTMLINGLDVTYGAPYERDIGMVFQNYALFPHMTVEDNIAFPLKMRGVKPGQARQQAQEALEMVRLPHVAQRFPKELSGGQQQRIALARCMVYRPAIILMDEPLGALDKKLRDHMQMEIKRIHRELGTTIVYVTHDQEEAMTMSDRICLMNGGRIEQLGTPADLYFRPRTLFVADFLGESNLFEATVAGTTGDGLSLALDGGRVQAGAAVHGTAPAPGQKVRVLVRPQNLGVKRVEPDAPALSAQVLDVMITGSLTKLYLKAPFAGETPITVAFPTSQQSTRYRVDETLWLQWQAADAVAIVE